MIGLNPEPCASYGIKDRFFCCKCQKTPTIKSASVADSNIHVTLACHGQVHEGMYSKHELTFVQNLWDGGEE